MTLRKNSGPSVVLALLVIQTAGCGSRAEPGANPAPAPAALTAPAVPTYSGRTAADWLKQLETGNRAERVEAGQVLLALPTDSRDAFPALLEKAANKDHALEGIQQCLDANDLDTRYHAARVLGAIGPPAAPTVPALLQTLATTRITITVTVPADRGRTDPFAAAAYTVEIQRKTKHSIIDIRCQAALALGQIKVADERTVGALAAIVGERETRHHRVQYVNNTNGQFVQGFSNDPLSEVAEDANMRTRQDTVKKAAARALGELGLGAAAAVTVLARVLADKDGGWDARIQVFRDLKATEHIDTVVGMKADYQAVRAEVARALGRIAPGDPKVVALLDAVTGDETEHARVRIAASDRVLP